MTRDVGSQKMKILGMELYPKRKTDDQYVTSVRKLVSRSRWFGVFHAVGAVFFFGMYHVIWNMLHSVDFPFHHFDLQSPVGSDVVKSGFHVGVMLGAFAGIHLVFAVLNIMWAMQYFRGQRTERLMLKFHDELKEQETSNQKVDPIN